MNRKDLPPEEEQFQVYRRLAEALHPAHATIRHLDIGGIRFFPTIQGE